MAGLGLVLVLMILAVPVLALVLAVVARGKAGALDSRVARLERESVYRNQRLRQLERGLEALRKGDSRDEAPVEAVELPVPEPEPIPETVPPPAPVLEEERAPEAAPPPSPAVEETRRPWLTANLSSRLPIALGSLALALAGAFLVKYTVEHGLIGPTLRIVLGFVFGAGMVAAGEWMRSRSAGIAQGLAAAGVSVVYATVLSGVNLWDVIPAGVGFFLMAANTVAAVILSLRHGPWVAVLGMVGGFLTPFWIGTQDPSPGLLFTYLFFLQVGLLTVARRRQWWIIPILTLAGSVVSSFVWFFFLMSSGLGTTPALVFVLASSASFVLAARSMDLPKDPLARKVSMSLVWGSLVSAVALLGIMVAATDFAPVEWTFLGIVGAGTLVLGRIDPRYEGLGAFAAAGTALLLFGWTIAGVDAADGSVFAAAVLALGSLYAFGGWLAMRGSVRPDRWAVLSGASAVAYTLIAYAGIPQSVFDPPWGLVFLGVATLCAAAAVPVLRRRKEIVGNEMAATALASASAVLAVVAVPMELEREWITVAWALGIPVLAWASNRLRLPLVGRFGWVLALFVTIRLVPNPGLSGYPLGDTPLWNWMLWGYGLSIAALTAGSVLHRRNGERRFAEILAWASMALGLVFLTLEIRHLFHGERTFSALNPGLGELGTYSVAWLVYALALLLAFDHTGKRRFLQAGGIVGAAALVLTIMLQGLTANPLWQSLEVHGVAVFNTLLWTYGAPALLAVLLAWTCQRLGLTIPARAAGASSLVLLFLLVTLEVRHAIHGTILAGGSTGSGELYAYSVVWILLALALLAAGVATRGVVLRVGSAAVMAVAVFKVFLVDTASLDGLYRVFSLLCLGASLLGLAWVYQRFVFRGRDDDQTANLSGSQSSPRSLGGAM